MKNRFICCLAFSFICIVSACNKFEVEPTGFDVTVQKNTYNLGDTVRFLFKGDSDYIVFYSGETGHKYEFKDRQPEIGNPVMNFTSLKTGNSSAKIDLFVLTDFNGDYTKESVQNATKQSLSNLAVFSTGTDNTPSGDINLKEYYSATRPIYLAFVSTKSEDVLNQVFTHSIKTLNIRNVLPDGSEYNVNSGMNFQGWKNIDFQENTIQWSVNTSNQLTVNSVTANRTLANEDWAISGPIDLGRVIPDKAIPIKSMAMVMPTKYEYVFAQKGIFKVSFVAFNQALENKKEVVKEFTIQIN